MNGRGRKAPPAKGAKRTFFRRRTVCKFTVEGIEYIDYKDVNLLRQFVPERAKVTAGLLAALANLLNIIGRRDGSRSIITWG